MARTRYGTSFWIDRETRRAPAARPALKGQVETEVAIVGGGLTGAAVACQFARAGVAVTLLEAGRAGASAALDAGWVVETPGVPFRELQVRHGLRAARRMCEQTRRAALDAVAWLRRLEIKADHAARDVLTLAVEADGAAALAREQEARAAAGLDAAWLSGRRAADASLGDAVRGAMKTYGAGLVDPLRVARGLLEAAEAAGAQLHEHSPVTRVKHGPKQATITTAAGTLRANAVVLATGAPRPLVPALQRHVRIDHTYVVVTEPLPAPMRRAVPAELIVRVGGGSPLAFAVGPQQRLVIQGGDRPAVPPRAIEKAVVQRAGQLMYELSLRYPAISGLQPEFVWTAPRVTARDGLLLAGPHRNFPRHLFALGMGGLGLTGAFLAARVLLRHLQGEPEPGDELFGFGR